MADGEIRPPWNIALIRRVFAQLEGTDVDELEVHSGDFKLHIRRDPAAQPLRRIGKAREERAELGQPLLAPLTGVFYSRPSPDQPAYVEEGQRVEAGQVVGLIETMKLFNEVLAEVGGRVLTLQAKDGDLVESGQVLMRVEPEEVVARPDAVV